MVGHYEFTDDGWSQIGDIMSPPTKDAKGDAP